MKERICDGCGYPIGLRTKSLTVCYMTAACYELCVACGLGIVGELSRLRLLSHRIRARQGKAKMGTPVQSAEGK
ncbi:MAG: hypothetical protein HY435_03295 [Candidatus Liptonbacteria bacterium]|nr:hypothetical protein [Candidatus Liptonbacteria bacterium]